MLRNILSLFALQGANYLIPLITLPFLVKTLGPEAYGYLGISLAIMQYICMITDYGFNLTATNELTKVALDKRKVSELLFTVMSCKCILFAVCILCTMMVIYLNPAMHMFANVIYSSIGIAIGNVLFPVWLFQGKEKMTIISSINIMSRLITLPLIFIFINGPDDAYLVAVIMSLGALMGGGVSIYYIFKWNWVILKRTSWHLIKYQFYSGWHVFLSTASVSLYTTCIPLILGAVSGPISVGYYVAADKIKQAIQGLIGPVSQVVYPRISYILSENKKKGVVFIRKLLLMQTSMMLLFSVFLFFSAEQLVTLIYGNDYKETILVLQVLSPCLFLIGVSNVLGIQTMLTFGMKKEFSTILLVCGMLNIIIIYPLSIRWNAVGAAVSILITECIVVLLMAYIIIYKKKLSLK